MSNKIVVDINNIKNLREKLVALEKSKMFDSISQKMQEDIKSLDWAINELSSIHFSPVILGISNSPTAASDLADFDNIPINDSIMFVCIAPTKVEATVLHKYFIPVDEQGTKVKIKNCPSYLLCDEYITRDGLIYIEGYILNTLIAEIGKRGVREQLSNWLRELLETQRKGEQV